MDVINYSASRRLFTIARGHPYERDAFHALFAGLDEYDVNHAEQPVAQQLLGSETASEFVALFRYYIQGVTLISEPTMGLVSHATTS